MIDAELDMISDLPGHVIDVILSHLPIREAVRTSVLSKKWRNNWHTLSNLVFDASKDHLVESKFFRVVYNVLLHHSGPINTFKIYCYWKVSEYFLNDIDQWILHLAGRSIKELVLLKYTEVEEEFYKIPQCLFSCQILHRLELNYCCWVKPPKTFEGFKHLKSLYLNRVIRAQNDLENLISDCPLLEELTLLDISDFTEITIHAPNLKFFEFFGILESITFRNTFQLATISIGLFNDLEFETNQSRLHGCYSSLVRFFDHQPHIQRLVIQGYFLKYLTAGVVPMNLPTPCINLRSLSIVINFHDLQQIEAAVCLLRGSPNLQNLEIFANNEGHHVPLGPEFYCWEDTFFSPDIPIQVRHVKIHSISGFQYELDLIRFLLLYSSVLEKMIVRPHLVVKPKLVTELIRFKRSSREAEVIYST